MKVRNLFLKIKIAFVKGWLCILYNDYLVSPKYEEKKEKLQKFGIYEISDFKSTKKNEFFVKKNVQIYVYTLGKYQQWSNVVNDFFVHFKANIR